MYGGVCVWWGVWGCHESGRKLLAGGSVLSREVRALLDRTLPALSQHLLRLEAAPHPPRLPPALAI